MKRIINQPYFSVIRSVFGTFYLLLEHNSGYSKKTFTIKIILPSILLFLFGYIQKNQEIDSFFATYSIIVFLYIYCIKIVMMYQYQPSTLLLPVGRSKQFRIDLVLWFVKQVTMILWFSFIVTASRSLHNYMPDFTIMGYHFTYAPLVLSLIFWPAVIVPVIDIFVSFRKPPCNLITMVGFIITLAVLTGFFFVNGDLKTQLISMSLLISISNGFFILLTARYWLKCDNV